MIAFVIGCLAYAVTAAAFVAAAVWGVLSVDAGIVRPRRRVLGVALGLAAVQALLWLRLGAGLGG